MPPRGKWQSFRYRVGIRETMTEAEPRERLEEMLRKQLSLQVT